ncbi:MAG TPA: helix-turn-helix domain-containing protein, partial [Sphingomonas sp.]
MMSDNDLPGRPARLVARQISELLLARVRRWHALVPQERINGVVFDVVLSAGIAHLAFCEAGSGRWIGVDQAARLGRPVNATAIAQSMGLPMTTVRRHAVALVDAGLLVRTSAGFSVAPTIFAGDGIAK